MGGSVFKAIIVDDEKITRRGLSDYIKWSELDIEVAGEAADGLEGLELAERVKPDLMLCDIRMPRMDGIELSKKVKEILPECKIIFLSAYSDVQYLKSAIQLKAIDYVEKPVNVAELTELIRRTVILCKEEREKKSRELDMLLKIEKSIPYLRNKLLLNLVENGNDADIWADAALAGVELPAGGRYVCCVLDTLDKGALEKILIKAEQAFEKAKVFIIQGEIKQQLVFVCRIEATIGLHRIISVCRELVLSLKADLRVNTAIGISMACDRIYDLKEVFVQASEAAEYYFFKGINNVILYSDIRHMSKKSFVLNTGELPKMEKYIMEQDFLSALQLLDSIVDGMKSAGIESIDNIKQELFRVYLIVSKMYSELALKFENSVLWARIFATGDIFSIRNFIANSIMYIDTSIISARVGKDSFAIREVEAYIQRNYSKDISIGDIARAVYLTPTYLCSLFKKEKGETINDYITKVRIQNAMWLLKDRKLKLYEISLKVGYDDPNYFAKVFKKITGLNPSEYRDTV